MRILKFFTAALLSLSLTPFVFAGASITGTAPQPLQLFGLELETVDRNTLVAAAVSAGAKPIGKKATTDKFDITKLGLPGLKTMTLVFYEGKFALAKYSSAPANRKEDFGRDEGVSSKDDEALRKMLVSKYGHPQADSRGAFSTRPFDGQFIDDGKYEWKYRGDMRLVYVKPFFSSKPTELIYTNSAMTQKLRAAAEAASIKDAAQRAKAAGSAL